MLLDSALKLGGKYLDIRVGHEWQNGADTWQCYVAYGILFGGPQILQLLLDSLYGHVNLSGSMLSAAID